MVVFHIFTWQERGTMAEITLTAETGRALGSRPAGRLRAAGKIPAVVYGHGIEPIPIAVDARELRHALNTPAGVNALLALKVDGADHLTMARALQRHPVRHTVVHVDFQVVRRDEVVTADVPVVMVGDARLVHQADGVVSQELFTLAVQATPGNIPESVEVDISGLDVGDTIRVGDVKLPPRVATEVDPEEPVVVAQGAQVTEADLMTEAEAEAAREAAEARAAEPEAEGAAGEGGAAAGEGAGGTSSEGQ